MSATPESTFTNSEQLIADLQRQLAECQDERDECKAERDEALEQQTATAEVLQVINSSPGDLAPVFDAMLDKALRLCDAAFGFMTVYDGAEFHTAALRGVPPQLVETLREPRRPDSDHPVLVRFVRGESLIHVPDITAADSAQYPRRQLFAEVGGARSMIWLALRKDDALLGMITIYRQDARPFSDKQSALLQNFAAQAVIAMENARLLTETREALEQQTATAEVLQVINSSPGDLTPVFDAILEQAHELCGTAFGALNIYAGDKLSAVAVRGLVKPFAERVQSGFIPSHTHPASALKEGAPFVQVPDIAEVNDPMARAAFEVGGLRTVLFIPLRQRERLLGNIVAARAEVRPFSEKQIALLQNFAAQAVIAMENARLLTETRVSLEQQTATAEVLQVINSSPGDLQPVFDAILEKAHTICGVDRGVLQLYDGEYFRAVATHGLPEAVAAIAREPNRPAPGELRAQLLAGARFAQAADLAESEPYRAGAPSVRAVVDIAGTRSVLWVPLRKDGVLLGAISAARTEVRPFSDKDIALLENFAAQAVIAMENARLITETREALEQQTATAEVLGVINASPGDLASVFDAILEKAHDLCGTDTGRLFTYDGQRFKAVAAHGGSARLFSQLRPDSFIPVPSNPFARVLEGAPLVHIADAREVAAQHQDDVGLRIAVEIGVRSFLLVPLRKDDLLLGAITANRKKVKPFSDKQIALLQNFAAQAVIAMENARLLTETREALEQQTAAAEVLQVINSSPGDLAPVFDAMLEKAMRPLRGRFWSPQHLRWGTLSSAARGEPPAHTEWRLHRRAVSGPGTGHARIVAGEDVVHTPDLMAEALYRDGDPDRRAFVDLAGARTGLIVALRKEDALLGTIRIYRQEVQPFTDKQISLLQNFAAQAVIAMENARLITETREALEQQTATAEVLGVINSSPADLAPVFDAMLDRALRLCEAEIGTLWIGDGDQSRAVANRGAPPAYLKFLEKGPHRRPTSAGGIVHIDDIRQTEFYRSGLPLVRVGADVGGVRTMLAVPLRKDGAELGRFSIYRTNVRLFSNKQIALLENFAAQAVIAIENARLITETHEALEQQTATAEVLQVINSSPGDLAPVFDAMLEKAMRLCEADYGHVLTFDGQRFHPGPIRGEAEFVEWRRRLGPIRPDSGADASPLGRVMQGEHVAQVIDATQEKAYSTLPRYKELVDISGIRSQAAVALRKEDVLFGAIVVYRREVRAYTEKQIALLQNFAAQAVIAMENARLLSETREALEQQTATAEVLQVINSSPGDLAPVFDAMLGKAIRLCEATHGHLLTFDGECFHWAAATGKLHYVEWSRRIGAFRPPPSGPLGRITRGERVVHIADVREEEVYLTVPAFRQQADLRGIRSQIAVGLVKDNILLGAMMVYRQEVRPFSDKQIALLENLAAQAVIAMENARLINETREALEQQTATAEVLQVINSSPGDLEPVFDAMLEKAIRLCGGLYGVFWTLEGERARLVASRNVSLEVVEALRQQGESGNHPLLRRVIAGEHLFQFDLSEHDAYRLGQVTAARDIVAGGVRRLIWVAMVRDGAPVGAFAISRREAQPFNDKQIALLQNFAAQAVIAMENARLLGELRQSTEEVAELNRGLEARVATQVEELGRVGRLKRFLAPQLAELIVSHGDEKVLESHRREIVVVFCDLRGYTAFTETAEPEEVLDFLREYHGALGPLVSQFEGTLDQFSGDGIMVFFNDPVPCSDPAERAVKMTLAMREAAAKLIAAWRRRGRELGFGAGIAQGYATLGQIGFAERSGYTAIGTVCNVAARLCAEAKDGQILLSQRVAVAVEGTTTLEEIGALTLKGLTQPVVAYNVPLATSQPALRVIEGGPQSV